LAEDAECLRKCSKSIFFSKFRLDKSVDATAYKGIDKHGTGALGEASRRAPVSPAGDWRWRNGREEFVDEFYQLCNH
jgi:hypothetical protein